ncbi:MAG: hypothetical protein KGD74_06880 [Candidatus Lokiarchaeota archaeon]|nr:hypothetical protein [Candidatus Lokiarchaeota archaeon]
MKVAIIGKTIVSGGYVRVKEIIKFIEGLNHQVDVIYFPEDTFYSKMWHLSQRAFSKVSGKEPRLMKKVSEEAQKILKRKKYDVIISVETRESYVLTEDLDAIKIFVCESLESEQMKYSNMYNKKRINDLREMELEIMQKSDYVVFPWETAEEFTRKNFWNGNNFLTIRYGCNPKGQKVKFTTQPKIINLGNLWGYWTNKELLSYLSQISPYDIDVYSRYKPARKYKINYKGYAKSLAIHEEYQFGLNTVSKDPYKRNWFTARPTEYISYGLPTLSPDWHEYTRDLKGFILYNEDNFIDLLKYYSIEENWSKKSQEAVDQSYELDWNKTLKPFEKILSN